MPDNSPTLFRTATLAGLGLVALALLLSQTRAPLPDGVDLASRLMAPLAERPEQEQELDQAPAAARPQTARIHAAPAAAPEAAAPEAMADAPDAGAPPEGTGIAPPPQEESHEEASDEARDKAPNEAPDEANVENIGDSEGARMAVAELGGLDRAVIDRLLGEGAATLVTDLADGRQLMLQPGAAGDFAGGFIPWAPRAADHSQLQIVLPADTALLPAATIRLSLVRAVGPASVTGHALVLSHETEERLRAAQHEILAEAGFDHDSLLAEGRSVVTTGCWQARGALIRLTSVTVNGSNWRHPERRNC